MTVSEVILLLTFVVAVVSVCHEIFSDDNRKQ